MTKLKWLTLAFIFVFIHSRSGANTNEEIIFDLTGNQICLKDNNDRLTGKDKLLCERYGLEVKNYYQSAYALKITASKNTSIFIDGKIFGFIAGGQTLVINNVDSTKPILSNNFFLELQCIEGNYEGKCAIFIIAQQGIKELNPESDQWVKLRVKQIKDNNSQQILFILLIFFGTVFTKFYVFPGSGYLFGNISSSKERQGAHLIRQDLIWYIVLAPINIWILTKAAFLLENGNTTLASGDIILISLYPIFRIILIRVSGYLSDNQTLGIPHMNFELKFNFLFTFLLSLFLFLVLYNQALYDLIRMKVFIIIVLIIISLKTIFLSIKIINNMGLNNISSFFYLCGSELIPYIVLLKILISFL